MKTHSAAMRGKQELFQDVFFAGLEPDDHEGRPEPGQEPRKYRENGKRRDKGNKPQRGGVRE